MHRQIPKSCPQLGLTLLFLVLTSVPVPCAPKNVTIPQPGAIEVPTCCDVNERLDIRPQMLQGKVIQEVTRCVSKSAEEPGWSLVGAHFSIHLQKALVDDNYNLNFHRNRLQIIQKGCQLKDQFFFSDNHAHFLLIDFAGTMHLYADGNSSLKKTLFNVDEYCIDEVVMSNLEDADVPHQTAGIVTCVGEITKAQENHSPKLRIVTSAKSPGVKSADTPIVLILLGFLLSHLVWNSERGRC